MTSPLRISFARLCRDTRSTLDLTQTDVAAAVGISRSHYAGIEGGTADPSLDLVWRIAERLGIDLELIGRPPIVVEPDVATSFMLAARRTSIADSGEPAG